MKKKRNKYDESKLYKPNSSLPYYFKVRLGLKGYWKEKKLHGNNLKFRIRELKWELKYAWRRFWNGYDDRDVFNIDTRVIDKLIILLEEFKKYNDAYMTIPVRYRGKLDSRFVESSIGSEMGRDSYQSFTVEAGNTVIDVIIDHLRMSDEEYVEKELYGVCVYDDEYDFHKLSFEDYRRIESIRKQNQNMAFDLLKEFWDSLWY